MLQVVESRLLLEGSTSFHLIGNNVTLKGNTITSSENAISLQANDNLDIVENTFKESNALHLVFPDLGLRHIIL